MAIFLPLVSHTDGTTELCHGSGGHSDGDDDVLVNLEFY